MRIGEAITKVAKRTNAVSKDARQKNRQRRNKIVELYGIPYIGFGDADHPAEISIAISPGLVYYEQYAFKVEIAPFLSTTKATTGSATVDVNSATVSSTPSSHDHTTKAHTHSLTGGVELTQPTSGKYGFKIEGVDMKPYFMADQDYDYVNNDSNSNFIDGAGVFPSEELDDEDSGGNYYDVLAALGDMRADGKEDDAVKVEKGGWKTISISVPGPCMVILHPFIKYSVLNR